MLHEPGRGRACQWASGFAFGRAWAGAHWQPTEIPGPLPVGTWAGAGGRAGPGQECRGSPAEIQGHGSHEVACAASEVSSRLAALARRGTSRQVCRGAGARGTPRGRNRATGRGNLELKQ
jgi:hypothetical protein